MTFKRLTTFKKLRFVKLIIRTMSSSALEKIPDVDIDDKGRYKYILIKVTDQNDSSNQSKYVVRGGQRFDFHADVYDNFKKCVKPDELNVTTRILGGGWLEHGDKSILVEGASVPAENHHVRSRATNLLVRQIIQYGPADHSISANVLRKAYPDYEITCNNE
ncbi:14 kDa phosphohistidine phosphatase isoform X1 [Rhopalosiphum maidis]|uniref:14 kDa phosphohistidine phosphatase isoform X1 n=1 Tax=Rhopalosiphum maidis TaxID=43146 RepID=UPI000EFE418D|nr:14 kDa phosphohistidine phosphatase isoform X1 [Rhopalosiphum maidis]